jgi:Tat protein secretion system quality control protein TatD with DNase activity
MLIDSHAHLTSSAVFDQVDSILDRAQQAGVRAIKCLRSSQRVLDKVS